MVSKGQSSLYPARPKPRINLDVTVTSILKNLVSRYQFSRQKHLNFGLFWQLGQNEEKKKRKCPDYDSNRMPSTLKMIKNCINAKIELLLKYCDK